MSGASPMRAFDQKGENSLRLLSHFAKRLVDRLPDRLLIAGHVADPQAANHAAGSEQHRCRKAKILDFRGLDQIDDRLPLRVAIGGKTGLVLLEESLGPLRQSLLI